MIIVIMIMLVDAAGGEARDSTRQDHQHGVGLADDRPLGEWGQKLFKISQDIDRHVDYV